MDATKEKSRVFPHGLELLPLLFALLVVLIVAILSYQGWSAFDHVTEQAAISERVSQGTSDLLSSLKDAETAQRGYLLTGEDRYLDPYRQALQSIPKALDELGGALALPRPDQARRVEALKPLVRDKLEELRRTIELYQSKKRDEALSIVQTDRGQKLMDEIRRQCAEIQHVASGRVTEYSKEAQVSVNLIGLVSTVGSISLFILLLSSAIAIQRGTDRRQQLIEDLQQSEAKVKEGRDWLQTTIASIGDAVISTDSKGRVTFLNGVAQSLTGWSQEEAAGRPLEQVFAITNEETGATVENPVHKVLREGRVVGLANHTILTDKNGGRRPIDDSAAPIRAADGAIAGVVLVFRDVTQRKEIEKAIRGSEQTYRAIGESISYGVWICDKDGRNTYASESFLQLVGLTQAQCADFGWGGVLHPDDSDRTISAWKECVASGTDWNIEHRFRGQDGRYHWVLARGVAIRDESGSIVRWAGINLDLDQVKAVEENLRANERELRAANEALLRANEDLSHFAFAASHDLQEPLRMITSYSQLLVKGYRGKLDEEASMCVNYVTEGAQRMRELLSDLLAYTQVNSDDRQPAGLIHLNVMFDNAAANLRSMIEDSGARVTHDPLPVVRGEDAHFLQLFQNLIGNAIKYRSGAPPEVHVSASKMHGIWRVAVKDNGIGIDPEFHQKIFGVFKRLHGKAIPGTGIGLAICQRVVERYGGRIWVESEVNQGSTFYFTVPSTTEE